MRVPRRPTVLRRLEEAGRSAPTIAAAPLAGGPAGPEGKEGKAGPEGKEGPQGKTGAAGPTSGGLILVRAATTAALAANTLTGIVLEANANGALASQDGIVLAVGDRLLVKNEVEGKKNGVYEVTSLGAAGSKWKLTRISSMDESSEVVGGMQFNVLQGTQNGGVTFRLLTTGAITLGTTPLSIGVGSEWVAPAFLNSWANFETAGTNMTVAYRRSAEKRVTIRGLAKHEGSITAFANSVIFTLPEGFWPSKQLVFPGAALVGGVYVGPQVGVNAAGEVAYAAATTGAVSYVALNLSFYAD